MEYKVEFLHFNIKKSKTTCIYMLVNEMINMILDFLFKLFRVIV